MIEFDRYACQQAVRTLVSGLLAIFVSYYFHSSQDGWIILAAVLLVQVRIGYLFSLQVLSQLIFGLLATLVVFLANALIGHIFLLAVFLSAISFVSVYLGFRQLNLFLPAYLISLLAMISGGMGVGISDVIMRSEFVLCGMIIAMIATLLLWPDTLHKESKNALATCLQICRKLINTIFSIYLQRDYAEKHLNYEKEIYQLSQRFFYFKNKLKGLDDKIDMVFEIIMVLGTLRYRVKDYAAFEIVHQELREVLSALMDRFNQREPANDKLTVSIDRLEEVYRSALQVAAHEPLVFLFFIYNLRALRERLD